MTSFTKGFCLSGALLFCGTLATASYADGTHYSDGPVVNVAANYQVNPTLKTFARIDNLFNEHYQNPTGFLRPGIGAYAGVTYTGGLPRLPDFLTGGDSRPGFVN